VEKYSRPTILWEFLFGFGFLVNLLCFVGFVVDGDHFAIPVNLFFTYILLNLRAGQISKYEKTHENTANNKAVWHNGGCNSAESAVRN